MLKYRRIPETIEAEIFKLGMEDGWTIEYSGNMFSYYKEFETKQECLDFIKNDKGKLDCYPEEKELEIVYEEPIPFIRTIETEYDISEGDYIIVDNKGERLRVVDKNTFKINYELFEE